MKFLQMGQSREVEYPRKFSLKRIRNALFFYRELISYRFSPSFSSSCSSSCFGDRLWRKPKAPSDWDEIWQRCSLCNYASVDMVRFDVTHSRWWSWRRFAQKNAATWWVNANCRPRAYAEAYASSWSIVHSYLSHSSRCNEKSVTSWCGQKSVVSVVSFHFPNSITTTCCGLVGRVAN